MKPLRTLALVLPAAVAATLVGCSAMQAPAPMPMYADGELPLPTGYQSWPKFLSSIQRADAKQIREIYMNNAAQKGTAAAGFPNGTVFVMENYAAKAAADGTLENGPDGKLVKGPLLRVFVMGKNPGWGQSVPEALRTGNWVYSSYLADGKKGPEDLNTCRGCHVPHAAKDFVLRYDEFFQQRGSSLAHDAAVAMLRQPAGAAEGK